MTHRLATTTTVCPPAPRKASITTTRPVAAVSTISRRLFVETPVCPGAPLRVTRHRRLSYHVRDLTPPRALPFDEDRVCPGAPTKAPACGDRAALPAALATPLHAGAAVDRVCPGAPQRPRARARTPLPWLSLTDIDFMWQ